MSQSKLAANYEFPHVLFMPRLYQQREESCLMTRTVTNRFTLMQQSGGPCMQNLCNTGVLSNCESVHNFCPVEQLLFNT